MSAHDRSPNRCPAPEVARTTSRRQSAWLFRCLCQREAWCGGEYFARARTSVRVGTPHAASQIVNAALTAFGTVDILINDAGRAYAGGLLSSSRKGWDEITTVKLTAMYCHCKATIPNRVSIGGSHFRRVLDLRELTQLQALRVPCPERGH